MENLIVSLIIVVVVMLAIFLIIRKIVLWYFKINKIVNNQRLTNELLRKIYLHQGGDIKSISPLSTSDLKRNDIVVVKDKQTGEITRMKNSEWKEKLYYTNAEETFEVIDTIPVG